jgi:hypothetical protein
MASVACNSSLSVAAAVQCAAGKRTTGGGAAASPAGRKPVAACPAFEGLSTRSLSLRISESADLNAELASKRPESQSVTVCSLKDLRDRIATVKNTQKITDAMKLVAAAKVRRAQEAVVNGRPFSENLVKVLFNVNSQLQTEDIDIPLTQVSAKLLHYDQNCCSAIGVALLYCSVWCNTPARATVPVKCIAYCCLTDSHSCYSQFKTQPRFSTRSFVHEGGKMLQERKAWMVTS